jgi:uncharacterized membrane protein
VRDSARLPNNPGQRGEKNRADQTAASLSRLAPGAVTMHDPDAPPGWSYNPSSWPQRLPIIGLAALGFVIAAWLALYQVREQAPFVMTVWEPFFGNGSEVILNSWVSELLPVSDAALGALGYLADAVTGGIGGRRRWRTMPWLVVLFGLFVGPLGAVSVLLVILQPVLFDAWCTLCLATAAISILMIGPAMDEVLASLQHVRREARTGRSWSRAFWGRVQEPARAARGRQAWARS